ncbi:hypothetical protein ACVNNN_03930 [Lysinibacillus fusiformis]
MSEAAHRTPPGKDVGGTEINPSPCKVAFSAVDIIFFMVSENKTIHRIFVKGENGFPN